MTPRGARRPCVRSGSGQAKKSNRARLIAAKVWQNRTHWDAAPESTRCSLALPAFYCEHFLELLAPWGVTMRALFNDLEAERIHGEFPVAFRAGRALSIIEGARALTGEPALGVLLGLRATPSFFRGWRIVGQATSTRYAVVDASNAIGLVFEARPTDTVVTVVEQISFGPARDFVLLAALIGAWRACRAMFADLHASLSFAMPRPDYYERFGHELPPTRFEHTASQLCMECPGS
jgi:hypothetical protein